MVLFKVPGKESLKDLLSFKQKLFVKDRFAEQCEVGGMEYIELGFNHYKVRCLGGRVELQSLVDVFLQGGQCHHISIVSKKINVSSWY